MMLLILLVKGDWIMKITRLTIIGGDNRQKQVSLLMAESGFYVEAYGLNIPMHHSKITNHSELNPELFESEVIILPVPYKNQSGGINIKERQEHLEPQSLFQRMKPETIVIYGKQDQEIVDLSRQYYIHSFDIVQEESFSILNAIPTAEGAIQRAMEKTNFTLHGSKVLILGYGRIGRVLSRMLQGIGAKVTVEARKTEDLIWIEERGYHAVHLDELDRILNEQDIIFNTVPSLILNRNRLEQIRKDCVIIDLASRPGGVDFQAAREIGISASLELGLPGLVAPKTAASIICQVTDRILKKHVM